MDKERKKRYGQKLNFIVEKLSSVKENPSKGVETDAMLYRVQVAVDAAMDAVAMLVKDIGVDVSDDYHNLETLESKKIISTGLSGELKRANGLRNAIVHKYNQFEEELAISRIPSVKKSLGELAEIIEAKIDEL